MKWSPEIAALTPKTMGGYAQICGRTLARAHARSGDSVKIAAYIGSSDAFDRSLLAFSERYAAQVTADFAAFTAAISTNELASTSDEARTVQTSLVTQMQTVADGFPAAQPAPQESPGQDQ